MKANLNAASLSVEPGSLAYDRVPVPNTFYADGAPVDVPVIVVNGKYEGPVLYLDAACHGSEIGGTEILQRITREEIDPQKLHGAIIAIPIVNIPAFRICSGVNHPHDFQNPSSLYPGNSKGSMNQKIAHFIFQTATKSANYAIDFHAISHESVAIPFSYIREGEDRKINKKMELMARAFGITYGRHKWSGKPRYCTFPAIAPLHGLPTILVELPSQYVCSRTEVEVGIRGVLNVMKSLKMIKGKVEEQRGVTMIKEEGLKWFNASIETGGFIRPVVNVGERTRKGQEIAILVDAFGEKISSIISPGNGYLMAYSASFAKPVAKEGSWPAIIFVKD